MLCCNDADTGLNVTWHENEQTSDWSFFARKYVELKLNKEKQMTITNSSLIGASLTNTQEWKSIDWISTKKLVFRLQMRIAKAMREKKFNKVKALQRLLTRSYAAKCLAVRKVTSNKGAKTPGVDSITWNSDKQKAAAIGSLQHKGYKPKPVRRLYITKSNGKKRPLGILTMKDRAMQALSLIALDPVTETIADDNSYGFRQHRSCADAIEQCFIALSRKCGAKWILECDVESCFDNVNWNWLQDNVLMETSLLKKWLNAGYMEGHTLYKTDRGSVQGSPISPSLILNALSGLESAIKADLKSTDKVNVITFADDFVVTGSSKELLELKIRPKIESFLKQRGLNLSEDKTRVTHIDQGFDFLGFNIRKYNNGKLLIKPSKKSIKSFLREIRRTIKTNPTIKTENLIRLLNPKIIGWSNYFRHVISKRTFSYVDTHIFKTIFNWAKRRHSQKGLRWVKHKYFRSSGTRNWIFSAKINDINNEVSFIDLHNASQVKIKRHVKIRAKATPFDPDYQEYFRNKIGG